ncbi:biotin--[acetyl-CoA-carboxylase] ligase [Acidomonas methanolica]|uniref:biotin--[acetyl-CoA-carboxylase] ligase n=1 Tax=Acidomonas methanolica TaxID=437 RepID=UPI00211A95B9|nr:biotin--[acetyl-CoA-carboxylase] ligase [Acidomonas methanolica]MCQ9154619.1 biotin--[acetyl-CoA-carboxylase] ligase [Acidomonas methanolica]
MTPWRLELHDTLESTSDFCRARAEQGEEDGLAVLARRQTKGRGTRGRNWDDPGGNLALSFLLRPDPLLPLLTALPFLVAVAAFDAISPALRDARALSIKWPNDLLLNGAKTAGILIESGGGAQPWIVVGLGVNIRRAPEIPGRRTTCLAEGSDTPPDVVTLAQDVLAEVARLRAVFEAGGFDPVRALWLERAHPLGTPLAVKGLDHYHEGLFNGLDGDGRLLLRTAGGKDLRLMTGDVLLTG